MLHRPSTDQIAHDRVTAEPVGIIDVLIASQPREDCLPQQTRKRVTAILAGAVVVQQSGGKIGQAERVIQFPMQQQTGVRTNRRTPKQQLY